MAVIKCKMCGGDLVIEPDSTVAECEYCGSKQTIPTQDNEKKLTLFSRANRLRMNSEFDKAFSIYESIVAEFPEEAEAYWGLVLCKYGIEYVDDPATGKKIPTCHRSSFESVMEDSDLEQALENADVLARRVYREEAKAIEELRKGILEVSGKEAPYDIFICYKETAESGDRTIDSVIAQDVYDALTDKGYRAFFSRISLEDKLGQEYEPYIFAALNSAKIMLAFGTDYEYYNAVWVKNEWSRYLKLMAKDKTKHLIPCYKNIDAYDMPKEFAKLQAQDMGKVGAVQDLLRGIEKILGGKKEETVPAAAPVQQVVQQVVGGPNVDSLLDRGYMSLEDGAFEEAKKFFDDALNSNSKCAEAYLGLFMAEIQAKNKPQAERSFAAGDYTANRFYQRAKQFSQDALKIELADWEKKRNDRLAKEAEEARRAKEAAAEKEKKRCQEIAAIREQLKIGKFELTEQQKQDLIRLNAEAERLEKAAKKAAEDYDALPEHSEKARLEKELAERRAYFSTLGFFKSKEKKLVQEQISSMEAKLSAVIKKLETEKKDVNYTKDAASAQANTAADHKAKAENEARKILQQKLMDLMGVKKTANGNYTFGHYPQTSNGNDNKSIEWQVLDVQGSNVLLLSRYGLDAKPYNTEAVEMTWEECSLRSWLNKDFLNAAFSAEEQKAILTTSVDNSKSQGYSGWSTNGGSNTQDKVFLLSYAEANKYLNVIFYASNNMKSRTSPTAYAEAQGAYTFDSDKTADGTAAGWWWLRSPGFVQHNAACVDCDGSLNHGGVSGSSGCVRPAFWLDLESVIS